MCGFVGILHLDARPVERPMLAQMARAIAHRGPDGEGSFVDGPVGFHHKRLAIIDLHSGQQPMTRDGVTVVFNGEIYNYVELREGLAARGHRFDTTSDTEVLLRMYLEHGEGCVRLLNGMFAFLIYDGRTGQVLAARDHFGIKPLYCYQSRELILFASEVKAILQHPAARAAVDLDGLREYVTFQFVLGEGTLFRDVRKLLPGHYQVFDLASGRSRRVKYWEPCFEIDSHHNEAYFAATLRTILEDAIRLQLRSDVPVGAHLSGGMDSSLVTALAASRYPGRLKTFTGRFLEGPEFDESRYAKEAAGATGAEWFDTVCTAQEFVELLPTLVYHMDEPAAGPGLFPQYIVSRRAAEHVKVVLGGQGGDEIFGGYARYLVAYLEQALKGAIFETAEEGKHIVSLRSIVPHLPSLRAYGPMIQQFWGKGLFEPMDRRYFQLVDRSGGILRLFSRDFRQQYDQEQIFGRFQTVFNDPNTASYYNKMTHFDMVSSLPALLQVEDRMSMAVSIESRVPLLDHRLVDLMTSMTPAMKFKGGELKYIMKKATRDLIPPKVRARKDKMGFPVPLHLWARGPARDFFHDILLSKTARTRGLFNPRAVEQLMRKEAAFGRQLWGLVNLELWMREFIDGSQSRFLPVEPVKVPAFAEA
ncbi:MAG TPA: asparagine synthase (glutamine-hydrolyzing) [Gemmatimonadales bacterium]|jgi:asparagine synthase (glutamine-hydrolysing)